MDVVQTGLSLPMTADLAPGYALLQGPDNPFSNLLGYVVIFMVVVWPIIRGVLESAQKKREEFEQGQARSARARSRQGNQSGSGTQSRRRSLEEIMRGDPYIESLAEPTEVDVDDLRAGGLTAQDESHGSAGAFAHPADSQSSNQGLKSRASEVQLGGHLFDDDRMSEDLVAPEDFADVPSENELETKMSHGPSAPMVARKAAPSSDVLGAANSALSRLERPLTPWQRAFVYKEVLGPPVAMNSRKPGEI